MVDGVRKKVKKEVSQHMSKSKRVQHSWKGKEVKLTGVNQGSMIRMWMKAVIAKGHSYVDEYLFVNKKTESIYRTGLIKWVHQARVRVYLIKEKRGKKTQWVVELNYDINWDSTKQRGTGKYWLFPTKAQAQKRVSAIKKELRKPKSFRLLAQKLDLLKSRWK
jgi:hypothetical protein